MTVTPELVAAGIRAVAGMGSERWDGGPSLWRAVVRMREIEDYIGARPGLLAVAMIDGKFSAALTRCLGGDAGAPLSDPLTVDWVAGNAPVAPAFILHSRL